MKFEELKDRFERFLANVGKKGLIIYDDDNDGVCSAVIMEGCLRKRGFKVKAIASSIGESDLLRKIEVAKLFDFVVYLDLALVEKKKVIEELKKLNKPVMIIDHHIPPKRIPNFLTYINPRLIKASYYQPTSYVVYKLCNNKKLEWVAALGTISDFGLKDCRDLLKKYTKVEKKENIFRTKIWKYANLLYSSISVFGAKKAYELLKKSKSLEDFAKKREVKKAKRIFDNELKKAVKSVEDNGEFYRKVVFGEVEESVRAIRGVVALLLAKKYRKITVIYTKKKHGYVVSIRKHKQKVNLKELASKASKGIGSGGGHEAAAGAFIKLEKMEIFKRRILKFLENKK